MPQSNRIAIIIVGVILFCMLYFNPIYSYIASDGCSSEQPVELDAAPLQDYKTAHIDSENGILDPVEIWHTGTAYGFTQYGSGRTDVTLHPSAEVWLPAGAPVTYYSADCFDSGFFLVGSGGSADFGSPAGTMSWWGKWDESAPNGRFWGQDQNFESRWSSGRIVLDWGSDNTLFGTKTDWQTDHWYFFAIVWNQTSDYLAFFWGDETTLPTEDTSTTTWTPSVVGLHSRNCIMNSERKSAFVDGHVDEFRYFTIDRSLTDIRADYRKRVSSGFPGLSNYYTFENDLSDSAGGVDLEPAGGYAFSHDVFSISDGWNAEQLEVNVMGLKRLHALNGSFASGNPGVNDDWIGDGVYAPTGWLARRETSSFFGRQRASYISDEPKYVSVENEGYILGSDDFRHYNDTRIFWYQNVDNADQNDQFVFSMNYLYQNGPIGTNYLDIFTLNAEIRDSSTVLWNWSVDLVNTTQRQIWYSTGSLLVNLTDAPSTFELRIELEVLTTGDYVDIDDLDPDLDGDSTNGLRITALIDDVSLTTATVPSCESVDLSVGTRETGPVGINGTSGSGSASINYEFWNSSSIPISFSANTSVSFTYSAKVSRMTRLLPSLSTTDLQSIGVAYSVDSDMSVNLTLYTYVASYPEAEDLGLVVYHPHSWENATIEDPFGSDPGPIETEADYFEVPAGAIDSVGWWTIRMQGPNYAKSITTQKYLESGGSWTNESVYLTGDRIRCQITVGTTFDNPTHVTSLELNFLLPSDELWTSALLSNASGSTVTSMGNTFGSYNSSNGEWTVVAFWENGSAVAYGHTHFEIHHQLTMFAQTPSIQRNLGDNFTAAVYIHNLETGEPILGSAATVVSNWTGYTVFFSPNLAKGWWEADFNTSDIGVGSWTLAINATIPFFIDANCTIGIQVMTLTLMTTLGNYYVEISPGSAHVAKFRYMFLDGTGIEDANVFVATWSGPSGGLQYEATNAVPGEPGNYTIQFTSSIGGTYFITITGTKEDHSTAATSFYLIVGALSTELDVAGEELPDDLFYNQTYQFALYYSSGSFGIEGASINVTHHPAAVVNWTETGSGYYSFSIRVTSLGSYAIYIRFQEYGYSYADTSLYFNVVEIPTSVLGSSDAGPYYESRTYEFAIFYNSTIENGITGAAFTSSASIRAFFHFTGSANGWYYFTLTPLSGDWNATFWLSKQGYQEREFTFVLVAAKIPIVLSPAYPLNQTYSGYAGSVLLLELAPIALDTGEALYDAIVEYALLHANGNGDIIVESGPFAENLGIYSVNITIPSPGLYLIRITILKASHYIDAQEVVLSSEEDPAVTFATTFTASVLGALAILILVSSVMVSRRFYGTMKTKRNLELMELKSRLDASKNLIGLLVIHRKVGLPVYSRIIKGAFEESMLSSFITAITQFRAEFSWSEPIWTAIPITEVVTAVQTETLICATITVEPILPNQKEQLETFGKEVGRIYDKEEEAIRSMFATPEMAEAFLQGFDTIFEDFFDGGLLKRYVGVKKSLPDNLKPVVDALESMSIDYGVTPDALVKAVMLLGYSERTALNMVLESIDGEFLIPAEGKLPSPPDLSET